MNTIFRTSFLAFRVFAVACLLAMLAAHPVWAVGGGSPDPSGIPVLQALRVELDGLDQDFLELTASVETADLSELKRLADELARIDAHFALAAVGGGSPDPGDDVEPGAARPARRDGRTAQSRRQGALEGGRQSGLRADHRHEDAALHAGDRAHADRAYRLRAAGRHGAGAGPLTGLHGALPAGVPCPLGSGEPAPVGTSAGRIRYASALESPRRPGRWTTGGAPRSMAPKPKGVARDHLDVSGEHSALRAHAGQPRDDPRQGAGLRGSEEDRCEGAARVAPVPRHAAAERARLEKAACDTAGGSVPRRCWPASTTRSTRSTRRRFPS